MTDNPYSEIDKELVGEIYTSPDLMDNLKILCDVYGSRFAGSQEDHDSALWMVERLKSYGLQNAHYESFKFPGWIRGPATLNVTSPIEKKLFCRSLPNNVEGEVESKLVFIGDGSLEVYNNRQDEIRDNIVMVTNRQPAEMKRRFHRTEKFIRSVLAGAKGWIFMNQYPSFGPPTGAISPIIPSVGISHEDGMYLLRLLEKEDEVTLRIKTTDKNLELTSYNVICDILRTWENDEYVVVGCHYDGHDIAQGALDPASGTATILEIARVLWKVRDRIKRNIRLICFGSEELGLFGGRNYVQIHSEEMDKIRFMLNLDAAGIWGKKGVILHDQPSLEPFFKQAKKEMNAEIPIDQMVNPFSDHWPFFLRGVPTGEKGDPEDIRTRKGLNFIHTSHDTVDKVNLENMRRAASNYARILLRIANANTWNPHRKTSQEIDDIIHKHGFDETTKLVKKVKEYVKSWSELHPDTIDWLNRESAW